MAGHGPAGSHQPAGNRCRRGSRRRARPGNRPGRGNRARRGNRAPRRSHPRGHSPARRIRLGPGSRRPGSRPHRSSPAAPDSPARRHNRGRRDTRARRNRWRSPRRPRRHRGSRAGLGCRGWHRPARGNCRHTRARRSPHRHRGSPSRAPGTRRCRSPPRRSRNRCAGSWCRPGRRRGRPGFGRQARHRAGVHLRQRTGRVRAVIARPALRRDRLIPPGQFPRRCGALPRRPGGLAWPVVPAAGGAQCAPRAALRACRGPAPGRRVVVTARLRLGRCLVVVPGTPGRVPADVFWVVPAVAGHPPAPGADATSSPAGSPVERSASSAPCRMSAAAALSTCVRRCRDPRPPWRSAS